MSHEWHEAWSGNNLGDILKNSGTAKIVDEHKHELLCMFGCNPDYRIIEFKPDGR